MGCNETITVFQKPDFNFCVFHSIAHLRQKDTTSSNDDIGKNNHTLFISLLPFLEEQLTINFWFPSHKIGLAIAPVSVCLLQLKETRKEKEKKPQDFKQTNKQTWLRNINKWLEKLKKNKTHKSSDKDLVVVSLEKEYLHWMWNNTENPFHKYLLDYSYCPIE